MDRKGEEAMPRKAPSTLATGTSAIHEGAPSADSKKLDSILSQIATIQRSETRLAAREASLQAERQRLQEEKKSLQEEKKSLQEEKKSLQEEKKALQEEEGKLLGEKAEISRALISLSPESKDGQLLRVDLDYVVKRLRGVHGALRGVHGALRAVHGALRGVHEGLRDVKERQRAADKACNCLDEQLLSLSKRLEKLEEAGWQVSQEALLRLEIKETESEASANVIENSAVVRAVNHAMERFERNLKGVRQDVKEVRQDVKELSTYVVPETARSIMHRCNPWKYRSSTIGSSRTRDDFKSRLIAYYGAASTTPSQRGFIKDMVTGQFYPSRHVTAAHIWKWSTRGEGLEEFFNLKKADFKSVRNGLLLLGAVEKAFDMLEVCFIYNPFQQDLRLFVVNPKLKKKVITWDYNEKCALPGAQVCFEDVHKQPLHLITEEQRPFLRILAHHARLCFDEAKTEGWVTDDSELAELETVRESLAASEGALWPKDMEKYPEAYLARLRRSDSTDGSSRSIDESLSLTGR